MKAEQLLQHFERISEAPDAIPHLRRFILDLAVRGKLVEQDPSDEPASELFKRITAEMARLVKMGDIRKPKKLPAMGYVPFGLPTNWLWTQIREVTSDRGQEIPQSKFTYIDVTAIDKETGVVAEPKILEATEAPSRARKKTNKGDVVYSCVRPYLLNVAIIDTDFEPKPIASTAFAVLNGHGLVLPRYLWIVLRSPFMLECVEGNQRGQVYPAINDSDFAILPFPLPPLAEQHRIVEKLDELMSLCDQLEAAKAEREQCRDHLVGATLQNLNQPAEEEETFREHALFTFTNLPRITTRATHIKQLRQTILNLAVRGKLAEQSDEDKISCVPPLRKYPATSEIDRVVFDQARSELLLPGGWQIAPLALLSENIVDCPHTTPKWTDHGEICIRTNQLQPHIMNLKNSRYVSKETYFERIERLEPKADEILYSREGGILGIACRVPSDVKLCLGQRLMLIRVGAEIRADFLEIVLNSPFITDIAKARTTGGAAPRVNMSTVRAYPIPLPPLAEQHRIVAKVDELMSLCYQLEAQITVTEQNSRRFLESVLAEALAPGGNVTAEAEVA
jgi:type I restriction enzyme S subunit